MTIRKPHRRLSRKEQAEANQKRLLDAALEVFTERGFHGATLEQIAARAGFTTGVVYSRFASKADLFLALLERTIEERIARLGELDEAPAGDVPVALTRSWWDRVRRNPAWMLVVIEFRVHAARDPQLNARYSALHTRHVEAVAAVMARDLTRAGARPAEPPVDAARISLAMGVGMVLERWALGDDALGDLPERAAKLMQRALATPAGRRSKEKRS